MKVVGEAGLRGIEGLFAPFHPTLVCFCAGLSQCPRPAPLVLSCSFARPSSLPLTLAHPVAALEPIPAGGAGQLAAHATEAGRAGALAGGSVAAAAPRSRLPALGVTPARPAGAAARLLRGEPWQAQRKLQRRPQPRSHRRGRWPDCAAPPRGLHWHGRRHVGDHQPGSQRRTRRSRGCSGRGDPQARTRSGRPSGQVGSGTRRWRFALAVRVAGTDLPAVRTPVLAQAACGRAGGERKRVQRAQAGHGCSARPLVCQEGPWHKEVCIGGGAGPPSGHRASLSPWGAGSLPAPNSEPQAQLALA